MVEPGYSDPWENQGRKIRDRAHDMEHALKRMEHDLKRAERDRMYAVRDAMKNGNMTCGAAASVPRTVEEVLVEIDGYLSYLEDMPKEKLALHEGKVDSIAEHMEKVRGSLKNKT